jgi:hypothetical protein
MDKNVKSISSLISAFETRNEILHEEIKRNEEAIKKMEQELLIMEDEKDEKIAKCDKKVKVVA